MAVSAASAMSLKRSISSLDLAADARAARARRSAQPSNKEGLEDPTLETPLKDTGLPPSPPAPPIDGRTLFDLEVALTIAKGLAPDEDLHEALLDHMKAEAEVSPEGLATLAQLLADETTADKTTTADDSGDGSGTRTGPMTNSWGPVIIEGWPGVPETTEEGYTSSSSQPDSEATLVLPTREKKRQAIVEKHFDVSWPDLDYDARACLLYYLVDHGKVEEEDIAFTDDGGAFAADGAQPGSEGDAGWVAMLE